MLHPIRAKACANALPILRAAPHDFGVEFVSDVLATMAEQYPTLTVELALRSHFEDLISQSIDVALRIGQLNDSSLFCRRIGSVPRALVASSEYLNMRGLPRKVEDLEGHSFIFYTRQHAEAGIIIGTKTVKPQCQFIVNSVSAIRQLVLGHKGMHLGPVWAFKQEIEQGKIVSVLSDEKLTSFPIHALYQSRSYTPAKIRTFIDLLVARYGGNEFT